MTWGSSLCCPQPSEKAAVGATSAPRLWSLRPHVPVNLNKDRRASYLDEVCFSLESEFGSEVWNQRLAEHVLLVVVLPLYTVLIIPAQSFTYRKTSQPDLVGTAVGRRRASPWGEGKDESHLFRHRLYRCPGVKHKQGPAGLQVVLGRFPSCSVGPGARLRESPAETSPPAFPPAVRGLHLAGK